MTGAVVEVVVVEAASKAESEAEAEAGRMVVDALRPTMPRRSRPAGRLTGHGGILLRGRGVGCGAGGQGGGGAAQDQRVVREGTDQRHEASALPLDLVRKQVVGI